MGLLDGQSQQNYYNSDNHGNYQFVSLKDVINQFMVVYVGEEKLIRNANKTDVAFHAQRALAELSFDTFKSFKSQEFVAPSTLQVPLPQDYVNYTKISWVDGSGIKHPLYSTKHTSNPTQNPSQDLAGDFKFTIEATFTQGTNGVELDGLYPQLRPGMRIISPHVPVLFSVINAVGVSGTTMSVKLADTFLTTGFNPFSSNISGTITVEVLDTRQGSLSTGTNVLPPIFYETSGVSLSNITLDSNAGDVVSFDLTSGQVSKISVGMSIHGGKFGHIDTEAKVVAINGNKVTVSHPFLSGLTSTNLFFVSIDNTNTWQKYKSFSNSQDQRDDYKDDSYWPLNGQRYGLEPELAQANGTFYIDQNSGKIHLSSNVAGKILILDYISDSLGTDEEMKVHKLAEEAMYSCIAHAVLAGRANIPEYQVMRFKKEKFAAVRKAKLRLSSIKLEELTQILRGKSKQIKH